MKLIWPLMLISTVLSTTVSAEESLALITVQGSGMVAAAPDQARLQMTVGSRQTSVNKAKIEVDGKMAQLTSMVQKLGIATADINNAPLRIYPEYQQDQKAVEMYRVERELTVQVRDLTKYPALLEQAAALGITQLSPAELLVSEPAPLYQQALSLAYADAEQKAQQLAKLSGRKIKQVHQIQEQGVSPSPRHKMAMMASEALQFGSNQVRADLSIQFELAKP
ncbi:SIMPL domain-containing protein [Rheinheimera sp.]|uniref:SIMPL domain-containing protein n=1 Tax=Rheinheimera sp. TaxID=1869214 RepID=UPI0027B89AF5|nr:SIMPL domain-containing protein [Rheinheimera sp.]